MAVKEKVEIEDSPLEVLEPDVKEVTIVIGADGPNPLTYIQKPLSFFGKIEFFSVMGKAIERVLSEGGSISEIIDSPEGNPLSSEANEADAFIKSIAKIVQYAPETLLDIYVVILNVSRGEREYVKDRLEEDLTDDQGFDILNTFVDQNWEILIGFFTEKGLPLFKKITQKLQKSDL